jgi:hypothetical protein
VVGFQISGRFFRTNSAPGRPKISHFTPLSSKGLIIKWLTILPDKLASPGLRKWAKKSAFWVENVKKWHEVVESG